MNKAAFLGKYGPWAVVTGASDGIGQAFARQLATLRCNLVPVARRVDRLQALAVELRANSGIAVQVVVADLSTPDGQAELEDATRLVDVGLLVAAAGFGTSGQLVRAELDQERNMLEVNCFAVLRQCRIFGERFAQRGTGGIILLASLVGWQGVPNAAHYAATKAYVQSLGEALRVELGPSGIDVLSSAPGPVHSGFASRANMVMGAAVAPKVVARESLEALGKQGTVIPGNLSKLLTFSLLPLPRSIRTPILAQVMGGMTKHQTSASAG